MELNHINFDSFRAEVIEELFRVVILHACTVEEPNTHDARCLLLRCIRLIENPHADDDIASLITRVGLEAHPHPSIAFIGIVELSCGNGIGKGEERCCLCPINTQALQVEILLVL